MLSKKSIARLFLVSVLNTPIMAGASPPFEYSGDSDAIWTDRPVRIDRSTQNYERLPGPADRYFSGFRVTSRARFVDGMSFAVGDRVYLVRDVVAPEPKKLCKADDGRRFVCGAQARALLRSLIFGRYIECSVEAPGRYLRLLDCRVGTENVAERLITSGFARAVTGGGLESLQQKAILLRSGLWADPRCRASRMC